MKQDPSTWTDQRLPHLYNLHKAAHVLPGWRPAHSAAVGNRRHLVPNPPRRSARSPAWRRAAPLDLLFKECRAAFPRPRALESAPAAPVVVDTSCCATPLGYRSPTLPSLSTQSPRSSLHPLPARPYWIASVDRHGPEYPRGTSCRRADRSSILGWSPELRQTVKTLLTFDKKESTGETTLAQNDPR